jgi:hypothetical protein
MIGTILSMHYIGKKNWAMSIIFWLVYLVSMAIVGAILNVVLPTWTLVSIVVAAIVFIVLANKWYKFNWMNAFKVFALAVVIDVIIVFVILSVLIAFLGYALPTWLSLPFFFGMKI